MKKTAKVLISVLLVGSMAMSLTGCFGASKAVKEAATEFMEAALDRDAADMADVCYDDEEAVMYLAPYCGENEAIEALLERAEFSIGKISVNKDKATATVTVTFPDYEAALDEDPEDVDEFCDLLDEQRDTIDIEFEIEMKKDKKDNWLVNNPEDVAEDFFGELYDIDFGFTSLYEGWIRDENWWNASSNVYSTSTSYLDLDLHVVEEHYSDRMTYYFEVYHESSLFYTSEMIEDAGFLENYCRLSAMNLDQFPTGSYTFVLYDANGAEFYRSTCQVG